MNFKKFIFLISKEFLHFSRKNCIKIYMNFRKNLKTGQKFLLQKKIVPLKINKKIFN